MFEENSSTSSATRGSPIPSLDGLRAVSILIVFLGHAQLSPLIPGGFGVTVFFFLSGYLITTLLIREVDRYGRIAFGAFFGRRAVRLLPPLLVTMLASGGLAAAGWVPGDLDLKTFFSQILFYYNYFAIYGEAGSSVGGFAILWSLSVEEHFYLIWPGLFLLLARGKIGTLHLLGLVVAILMWRAARYYVWLDVEWTIYTLTDTRFDGLLFGCLLAVLEWRGTAERMFPKRTSAWAGVLVISVVALLASFLIRDPAFRSVLRYTVQGFALMPIFHYAVAMPNAPLFRPLNWVWVRRIGVWSYTLYLCHYVAIHLIETAGGRPGSAGLILAAGAISLGWAALVYELVERPLKPLRSRLTGHVASGQAAQGSLDTRT